MAMRPPKCGGLRKSRGRRLEFSSPAPVVYELTKPIYRPRLAVSLEGDHSDHLSVEGSMVTLVCDPPFHGTWNRLGLPSRTEVKEIRDPPQSHEGELSAP